MTAPKTQDDQTNNGDQNQLNTQNGPTNDDVDTRFNNMRTAFFSTLAEKEAELNRLKEELNQTRVSNRETREPEQSWREFTGDPETVITRAIEKQLKPLKDDMNLFKAQQALDRELTSIAAQNANYAKVVRLARGLVEQVLGNGIISAQTVFVAVNTVLGMINAGTVNVPGWETPKSNDRGPIPPRVPSNSPDRSGPTPSTNEEEKPWENMSENEKKLARSAGMSYEAYWRQQQENMLVVSSVKKGGK